MPAEHQLTQECSLLQCSPFNLLPCSAMQYDQPPDLSYVGECASRYDETLQHRQLDPDQVRLSYQVVELLVVASIAA